MAGLVPAIHDKRCHSLGDGSLFGDSEAWVYIVTNRPNGILYTGVTSNLPRRMWEHREGIVPGFTKHYGLKSGWSMSKRIATSRRQSSESAI